MRAYQDMVFSTAARLAGNDAQAEDIAQEVFVKAYEHFDHLRSSATAGGWLKTVATNLSLNYLTRYRKRWRLFSERAESVPDVPLPDAAPGELERGGAAGGDRGGPAPPAGPPARAAGAVSLRGFVL